MNFVILSDALLDVVLGDAARNLSMLLRPLAQLLTLGRVIGRRQVRRRLLRKDVLDGEDFIEELELNFCGLPVRLGHSLPIVLHQVQTKTETLGLKD